MKILTIKIKTCLDCPYMFQEGPEASCAKSNENVIKKPSKKIPEWCPLEEEKLNN